MKILSAAQVRRWDQYTIQHEPISSLQLMERASMACTNWIINNGYTNRPIKIFCGKGNNGGDGIAIACQLVERSIIAEVFILEFGAFGTPDFQQNLSRLHTYSNTIRYIQDTSFFPEIEPSDIVIDALYGSGINRPLQDLSAQLVQYINASEATVIAIDLPSGLLTDSSSILNPVIQATITLTFQVLKLCFLMAENEKYFGRLCVLSIGLLPSFLEHEETDYELLEGLEITQVYKPRKLFSHKGNYGHCLMIAGEEGKMGAAILATKACLRSGAGLVTALLNSQHSFMMQIAVPEAMVHARDTEINWNNYNSIGLGPGLGKEPAAVALVKMVLNKAKTPLVIDADALNMIAENNLLNQVPAHSILTPHPKEFARLFGKNDNDFDQLTVASEKASVLNIYILLKGYRTAIICPDGKVFFNSTGNPGMATAGSGDVLTGIISGLLAQNYSPYRSAVLGVYLHGLAGDFAAKHLSQEAMLAGDIIRSLGESFKKISSKIT